MLNSIHSKIIGLLILIMVITALVLISISSREIGDAMLTQQDKFSRHVLALIGLNIKGRYQNLIADKIDAVIRQKELLKAQTLLVTRMLNQRRRTMEDSASRDLNLKQLALDWVDHTDESKFATLFIASKELKILAHPDKRLKALNIGGFINMKGKTLTQILERNQRNEAPIIEVINWEDISGSGEKVLICIRQYPDWEWVVGATTDITAIKEEAQGKLQIIIKTLNKSFEEIIIGETGFPFLFNDEFEILSIGKPDLSQSFQNAINQNSGHLLLHDISNASRKNKGYLSYKTDMFGKKEMITYVSFFKPLNWYIGVTVPINETKQPARAIASKQSVLICVILFVSILLAAWLVSRISKPINSLANWVKEFSTSDLTQKEGKEVLNIQKLATQHKDEVGHLAQAFVQMNSQLRENIAQLMKTTADNERMNSELNVAKNIQLGLLPKVFPPFVDRKDIGIYASLEPAKEVGGDLYDFYFVGEDRICFTIGDVSGKGVPAALMMAITKTLIKLSAGKNESPADIMMEVNNAIAADNPHTMFVTLFIGILDLKTGRIIYSNGGHNPPILVSTQRACHYVKGTSGPLVGVMADISYNELALELFPGEALFLYTDGVTEAQNPAKEFYTDERLLNKVSGLAESKCEETVLSIKSDVKSFADTEPQFDDIAMLIVRYRGREHNTCNIDPY